MQSAHQSYRKFETITVRAGAERDVTGAIAPPLHLSSNYEHGPSGERLHGFVYARIDNPTQRRLETALAALEGGEAARVFASGVAAGATFLQSLPPASHVLFPDDLLLRFPDADSCVPSSLGDHVVDGGHDRSRRCARSAPA